MVTVLRGGALRVVIFTDDHLPAHVHVFGDGQAKIDLVRGEDGGASLVWADGMNRSEMRRARATSPAKAAAARANGGKGGRPRKAG